MDNYQYRLLQLSIPTRTTKKDQELFLRDIFERHIFDWANRKDEAKIAVDLFVEANDTYNVKLPDYILATVYQARRYHKLGVL